MTIFKTVLIGGDKKQKNYYKDFFTSKKEAQKYCNFWNKDFLKTNNNLELLIEKIGVKTMGMTKKIYSCVEFHTLENRSMAENDPAYLVDYCRDDELKECFNTLGRQEFIELVNCILDENE